MFAATPPAYTNSLDLDDTTPRAAHEAITSDYSEPRPLPVLSPPRRLGWLASLRLLLSDWLSPYSARELAALRDVGRAAVVHLTAEAHWHAHCRDSAALKHWGDAQNELERAARELFEARNGVTAVDTAERDV